MLLFNIQRRGSLRGAFRRKKKHISDSRSCMDGNMQLMRTQQNRNDGWLVGLAGGSCLPFFCGLILGWSLSRSSYELWIHQRLWCDSGTESN